MREIFGEFQHRITSSSRELSLRKAGAPKFDRLLRP
jgi:hypothetical protein